MNIILPSPAGVCLHGRLSSNVRRRRRHRSLSVRRATAVQLLCAGLLSVDRLRDCRPPAQSRRKRSLLGLTLSAPDSQVPGFFCSSPLLSRHRRAPQAFGSGQQAQLRLPRLSGSAVPSFAAPPNPSLKSPTHYGSHAWPRSRLGSSSAARPSASASAAGLARTLGLTMASPGPHEAILRSAARAHLAPLGMKQKGRSRTWIKDNSWWLAVVEFQPSSWSKGSYLNLACMWLWHPQDHISFNVCERLGGYIQFQDEQSFGPAADHLASLAAEGTRKNAERFKSVDTVYVYLEATAAESQNPWDHHHAMMAALACGQVDRASNHLQGLLGIKHDVDWCKDLQASSRHIMNAVSATHNPARIVAEQVALAREKLSLGMSQALPWRGV